jgi:predicted GNAT family acetyltransferase
MRQVNGGGDLMEPTIVHEPGRFVVRTEDAEAELRYERRAGVLDVLSTYTPPALRGRGLAARLTEAAVAYARREGLRIRPTCSYTRAYLDAHPDLRMLAVEK